MRAANALFARYVADGERALAAGGEDLHADVEAAERDLLDEELAACAARAVRGPVHNADRARRLAIRFAKKLLVERWPCAIARNQAQLEVSYTAWSVGVFRTLITERPQ